MHPNIFANDILSSLRSIELAGGEPNNKTFLESSYLGVNGLLDSVNAGFRGVFGFLFGILAAMPDSELDGNNSGDDSVGSRYLGVWGLFFRWNDVLPSFFDFGISVSKNISSENSSSSLDSTNLGVGGLLLLPRGGCDCLVSFFAHS